MLVYDFYLIWYTVFQVKQAYVVKSEMDPPTMVDSWFHDVNYHDGSLLLTVERRGLYPDLFGEIGRGVPNVQAKKK